MTTMTSKTLLAIALAALVGTASAMPA